MVEPTREIFGNIVPTLRIVFYIVSALATLIFSYGVFKRITLYRAGRPEKIPGAFAHRLRRFFEYGVNLKRLRRDPFAFLMHQFMLWGFVVLFIGTVIVALEHHLKLGIYRGPSYLAISFFLDFFGLLFMTGLAMAAYRRWWVRHERVRGAREDFGLLALLFAIGGSGFLLEGFRIAFSGFPAWERWSFIGYALAELFDALGLHGVILFQGHLLVWWVHAFLALAFIALLPYTKLSHIFTSPANIFLASFSPKGALPLVSVQEVEETGRVGLEAIPDLSWRQRVAVHACTRCERCQNICPAFRTGTPLTPMGVVQKLCRRLDDRRTRDGKERLPGAVISSDELWACTTCRACAEICPVFIDHVELIVGMRRSLVAEGNVYDASARTTLMNIAGSANPWGLPQDERGRWAEGLGVKTMREAGGTDVLFWTGCFAAYDPRAQRIARALVKVLQHADVDFAILGNEERCTGDQARRLGEEFLFQELASANLETFKRYRFGQIITSCAHCFNTLKNEYPQFGGRYVVKHHSEFLADLIRQGKLPLKADLEAIIAYHDSCYLGRYNGIYDQPRDVLASVSGRKPLEMASFREQGLCCGGGGGHMWMEFTSDKKTNHLRLEEARATKAQVVATACPYCLHMLEDAVKAKDLDRSLHVKDLAELVVEALDATHSAKRGSGDDA
ncbi:MAG: heterodisulfide reductase-related iron-sulfur binding cluster [Candidatus Methylomirabilales bacterium]